MNNDSNNLNSSKKIPKASFVFCIGFGIILICAATVFKVRLDRLKRDFIELEATVSKVDGNNVYVNYYYNTDDYINVPVSMINKPAAGDVIHIYISREDFSSASSDELTVYIIKGFLIVGCIFFASGAVCLIIRRLLVGKSNPILENGKYIYAELDEVIYEAGITTEDGTHPYTIRCHYEDFNCKKRQDYVLRDVRTNPAAYLAANNKKIKIYVKGSNYKKYYFDQSVLKL